MEGTNGVGTPQPQVPVAMVQQPKSGGNMGLVLVIVVLVLVLIGGGVGAVFLVNELNKKNQSQTTEKTTNDKTTTNDSKKSEETGKTDTTNNDGKGNNSNTDSMDESNPTDSSDNNTNSDGGYFSDLFKEIDLPKDFPTDVPLYDNHKPYSYVNDTDKNEMVLAFELENTLEKDVVDFYKTQLPKNNWTIKQESKVFGTSLVATKANREISLTIYGSEADKTVSLGIILSEK